MTALGPIGALAICDVQTVRVFSFDATGSVGFAGAVSNLRVRVPPSLEALLPTTGASRELGIVLTTARSGFVAFAGALLRNFLRAPLRFAKRKGIVTRGVDR